MQCLISFLVRKIIELKNKKTPKTSRFCFCKAANFLNTRPPSHRKIERRLTDWLMMMTMGTKNEADVLFYSAAAIFNFTQRRLAFG